MPARITLQAVLACAAALWLLLGLRARESRVLMHAHAHKDYKRASPLRDALEQGFASIEADVCVLGRVVRRQRLGGVLSCYRREAA